MRCNQKKIKADHVTQPHQSEDMWSRILDNNRAIHFQRYNLVFAYKTKNLTLVFHRDAGSPNSSSSRTCKLQITFNTSNSSVHSEDTASLQRGSFKLKSSECLAASLS